MGREPVAFANFIMLLRNMGLGLMENLQGCQACTPMAPGGPALKAEWHQLKCDGL